MRKYELNKSDVSTASFYFFLNCMGLVFLDLEWVLVIFGHSLTKKKVFEGAEEILELMSRYVWRITGFWFLRI